MATLPIRVFGDPVLREKSTPMTVEESAGKKLAADMAATMYEAVGIGLAAPQIGVPKRLIVVDFNHNNFVAYLNPEILERGGGEEVDDEGCLSVPEITVPVKRARKILFRAVNLQGQELELEVEGFLARVLQHEVDHLEGRTIIDRTDSQTRRKALRRLMETSRSL